MIEFARCSCRRRVRIEVGTPVIAGALVAAELVEQTRGDKIKVFKKKRRKHYRRTMGHRQDLSQIRITEILTGGAKPTEEGGRQEEGAGQEGRAAKALSEAAAEPAPARRTRGQAQEGARRREAPAKKAPAKEGGSGQEDRGRATISPRFPASGR
jgi:large subunit ribosomal protein L21